jgi:hypothetical protein
MLLSRLALSCALAFLEGDTKPTQLPHDWAVGTAYHVEFTKSRDDFEEGQAVKHNSSRTPIDVAVIAKREDGYTYRWTFTKPIVETEAPLPGSLIDKMTNLVDGMKLDVLADASGSVTTLADPPALDAHFAAGSKILIDEIESKGTLTTAELASLKKAVASMKGPKFQASYLNFPKLFYMPAGASLTLGEKREYEDQLPNPFGGEPLPSKAFLRLTKLDMGANEAVIDWRQSIDPVKAGPILEASIREFAKRSGQTLPKEAGLSFDAIEDASTYVYDLTTGIPKSVVNTRTTVMAGRRRVDTHEFKVTWPAPPK